MAEAADETSVPPRTTRLTSGFGAWSTATYMAGLGSTPGEYWRTPATRPTTSVSRVRPRSMRKRRRSGLPARKVRANGSFTTTTKGAPGASLDAISRPRRTRIPIVWK